MSAENFGVWPLRGARQTSWSASTLFEARRPWSGAVQTRRHAGLDLHAAYRDDVLAPEECTVVDVDRGWDGSARATLVHTASGRSLLLGCTEDAPPPGTVVPAGAVVARIGRYTRTVQGKPVYSSMLHLQVYDARITAAEANKWQSWPIDRERPPHLIDPMDYLALLGEPGPAGGGPWEPSAEVPCPLVDGLQVCQPAHAALWEARARAALRASMDQFIAAWDDVPAETRPESVRQGVQLYNHAGDVVDKGARADAAARVRALVEAEAEARRAGELFAGGAEGGGGGAPFIAVATGVLGLTVSIAAATLRRRR